MGFDFRMSFLINDTLPIIFLLSLERAGFDPCTALSSVRTIISACCSSANIAKRSVYNENVFDSWKLRVKAV